MHFAKGCASVAKGIIAFACCGLLVLVGCGPSLGPLVPVKGRVLFNETPLPDGGVTYVPLDGEAKDFVATGPIESDGTYTLSTNGKPGAPLGKYRVVVSPGDNRKAWLHVGAIYTNDKKSPLQMEVAENKPEGSYDLRLLPKGQAARQ